MRIVADGAVCRWPFCDTALGKHLRILAGVRSPITFLADRLLALQLLIVLPQRPNQLRAVLGVFSKPQETPGQVLKLLAKKVVFLCQIKHICCPKAVGICWFLHWRMELPKRRSENANNPGRFPLSTVI